LNRKIGQIASKIKQGIQKGLHFVCHCFLSYLPEKKPDRIRLFIEFATFVVLSLTLWYIILYWEETQQMKEEMVRQNAISAQSQIISNLPIINIYVRKDAESEETWNTFIENKGNGPAYSIMVHRSIDNSEVKQKQIAGGGQVDLKSFTKVIPILGAGETQSLAREYGRSLDNMIFDVKLRDIFGIARTYKFEGTRLEPFKIRHFPWFDDLSKDIVEKSESAKF
jgi:hypothetical protein